MKQEPKIGFVSLVCPKALVGNGKVIVTGCLGARGNRVRDPSAYGVDLRYRTGFWNGRPLKTRIATIPWNAFGAGGKSVPI